MARCCLVRECDLWSVVVWPIAWLGSVTSLVCGGVANCLVRECDLSGLWWCGQLLGKGVEPLCLARGGGSPRRVCV